MDKKKGNRHMSMTKAQRKKQAKKQSREKKNRKMANIRKSQGEDRYRLDVLVDGRWIPGVMRFHSMAKAEAYAETTESRRRAGEEIAPGRVYDLKTGEIVKEIAGSKRKGAMPDVITDGPKADPNVTGVVPEEPVRIVVEETPKSTLTGEPDSK